jgi:HTH-type transcriptional regulator, sugar sensing transcriptional regulator
MEQESLDVIQASKEKNNKEKGSVTDSIVSYLEDFGLTKKEAKVYYILSRIGSASANEISSATQYNRLQTYRAVKGLLDRGLVEISLERPRRYTPLKIEHAINLLEQEAANRIVQLESKKPLLLQKWLEMKEFPVSRASCTFRIIQGTKNVLKFAIMLFDSAEKDVCIAIKGNEITRWINESVDDSLQKKTSKQVKIHVISESEDHNVAAMQRFLEFCDLRYVSPLNTVPLLLIDGKEVLMCLNGNNQGIPENAIWTNHPELVGMLTGFFNILWTNGKIQKTKG